MSDFATTAAELGVEIFHHFGGNTYVKETYIPKNTKLVSHKHCFDHLSILASGKVLLDCDGVQKVLEAPRCLTIAAHKKHSVTAIDDSVWFCIHATNITDANKIDETLIHD